MTKTTELLRDFLIDSWEGLDQLDQDLIALEQNPGDAALIKSVFRVVHTIKGNCGFLGFSRLERLAHVGETLLGQVREGERELDEAVMSAMFGLVDALREIIGVIQDTGTESTNEYTTLLNTLQGLLAAPADGSAPAPEPTRGDDDDVIRLYDSAPGSDAFDESAAAPQGGAVPATTLEDDTIGVFDDAPGASTFTENGAKDTPPAQPPAASSENEDGGQAATAGARSSGEGVGKSSIRVDVDLLESLMNQVGELVLARNQILQSADGLVDPEFAATCQRLNIITSELQDSVMKTRMQVIGYVWNRFPRVVRDVALACKKKVRIVTEGEDTELDRKIIEALGDPLTHIVRNAIDHGIESPEVRKQAGKPEEGTLFLHAFHEGGYVNIQISDDGQGLNVDRIREKAISRGLVSSDTAFAMSDREIHNLVFEAGFSTAAKVTNLSGRGVGMDVVRTRIEKIGGSVDIDSAAGKGTTIKIKIPLTLAIVPALMVTSDDQHFAIPQVSLLELIRVEAEQRERAVELIHDIPTYRLRGQMLPLVWLNKQLGLEHRTDGDLNIAVLQAGDRSYGLVVDSIRDSQEIVVKPLSPLLRHVQCYAGATIMGDGNVALILDALGTAEKARVFGNNSTMSNSTIGSSAAETSNGPGKRTEQLLTVAVGDHNVAIHLNRVQRLEEIDPARVEQLLEGPVVEYRGEIMPLLLLATLLARQSVALDPDVPLQVLVCRHGQRSVGFVVDQILDVIDAPAALDTAGRRAGVLGSVLADGNVLQIIDPDGLVRAAGISELMSTELSGTAV